MVQQFGYIILIKNEASVYFLRITDTESCDCGYSISLDHVHVIIASGLLIYCDTDLFISAVLTHIPKDAKVICVFHSLTF